MTARIYPITRAVERKAKALNALLDERGERAAKVARITDAQFRMYMAYLILCKETGEEEANLYVRSVVIKGT